MPDSDAAKLTAAPDAETLPGHTLHPWTAQQYGQAELYLESRHRRSAIDTAAGLTDWESQQVLDAAERLIGSGYFRFDLAGFRAAAQSGRDLPFFLRLCLRDESLTTEQAEAILKAVPLERKQAVIWAVLRCVGYSRKGAQQGNDGSPATGESRSSPDSSSAPSTPAASTLPAPPP